MNGYRLSDLRKKVIALVMIIGALPFVNYAQAHTRDSLFTYGAQATVQSTYIWRGMYAGGLCLQASANVGYGGLYADMWWNIGTTDWRFNTFLPELDITLGFNRWGVNIYALYIHNFNCGFFDFGNYADRGNRLEVNAMYTISEKIPLCIRWATRMSAADGYTNENGDLVFAWSSYASVGYTQALPYGLSLYGEVGMTPWRSCYTGYKGRFAVTNIDLRIRKDWSVHERVGLKLQGQVTINPYALAVDKTSIEWHPYNPGNQAVNANIAVGIYLK